MKCSNCENEITGTFVREANVLMENDEEAIALVATDPLCFNCFLDCLLMHNLKKITIKPNKPK